MNRLPHFGAIHRAPRPQRAPRTASLARISVRTLAAALGLFLLGLTSIPARAATLTVTSTADDGTAGTLRSQIAAAAPDDTIDFSVTGTISLATALPTLRQNVTITGPGANRLTVQPMTQGAFDIFTVNSGVSATVSGLTISNGVRSIFNYGTVTATNCTVSGNTTDGINNGGTVTLKNTLVVGNPTNVRGPFTDGGFNITTGTAAQAGLETTDKMNAVVLKDNGGPTQTIALVVGGAAVDQGGPGGPPKDQRGATRPVNLPTVNATGGDGSDIGTFELDPVQSGANVVVSSTGDGNDGVCSVGDCTLREAINAANANADNSAITFDTKVFAAAQTISLATALPKLSQTVTITGPGANLLTVQATTQNVFDIFSVNSGVSAAVSGLTISNGRAGIFNNGGTVTVTNCILSGNGTGIFNNPGGTVTVTNCTLSGNQTGIFNNGMVTATNCTVSGNAGNGISSGGTLTATNCTVSGNSIGIGSGGTVTVTNCTVSGNSRFGIFNGGGTVALKNTLVVGNPTNVSGGFTDGGFNITTGTAAQAGLDPAGLKDNGGPTQTIALVAGGTAVDKGDPALTGSASTFDQRGAGFLRVKRGRVDIGAFEVQNERPSVADFTKSLNEDSSLTFATADFTGAFSDPDTGDTLQKVRITALPTNGTLKLNSIAVTLDQEIATANLNTLTYTPAANFNGSDSFSFNGADNFGFAAGAATVSLQVLAVNDAPSFTIGANQSVNEDAGAQSVANFATSISAGAANESAQTLKFTVTNSNNALFSAQPAIAPNGTLTYTPAPNASGSATVSVTLSDNGGTANGGADTSATQTFTITVKPVNDAPVAQNQGVGTGKDTPLSITLTATDIDTATANLTYIIVTPPSHGTLSGSGATRTYTPDSNFSGADSFTFKANDGALDSNLATISITVGSSNNAPVAVDDSATTEENTPLDIAVLSNDTDAEGDALSIVRVTTTSSTHGAVTIQPNGTLRFVPDAAFVGQSTFSYTISDGQFNSTAMVTVTVRRSAAPGSLSLSAPQSTLKEGGTLTATVTLSRPSLTDVTITLKSSDTSAATVPASVVIAAGSTTATFIISGVHNGFVDGGSAVTITATATNYSAATLALTVQDTDVPTLTLTAAPATVREDGGPAAAKLTLSRNAFTGLRLRVRLSSSDTGEARVPSEITFPSGALSVSFFVAAIDDRIVDGPQNVTIRAQVEGFADATTALRVEDRGRVQGDLNISVPSRVVIEGAASIVGKIGISGAPLKRDLLIALSSSDPAVRVPKVVTLRAGQTLRPFLFTIVDDNLFNGTRQIFITARAVGFVSAAAQLELRDNDKATLSVRLSVDSVKESVGSIEGNIALRNGALNSAQTIFLSSSDPSRVAVPSQVIVPGGSDSAAFTLIVRDNAVADGSHRVTITATKAGATSGSATLNILDDDGAASVAQAPRSPITLSSASASITANTIRLHFSGALDAETAREAAHYAISVNGEKVEIESVAYQASNHTVVLVLSAALKADDNLRVTWNGLSDAAGRVLPVATTSLRAS